MKVEELIAILQMLDKKLPIMFITGSDEDGVGLENICGVEKDSDAYGAWYKIV